jgi:hypothetical protein
MGLNSPPVVSGIRRVPHLTWIDTPAAPVPHTCPVASVNRL